MSWSASYSVRMNPKPPRRPPWHDEEFYQGLDADGKALYDATEWEHQDDSRLEDGVTHVVMAPRKAKSQSK